MLSSSDCESRTIARAARARARRARAAARAAGAATPSRRARPSSAQAIAALYERTEPDDVIVTSCAEEGIFLLYHALLRPGDHAIVETPVLRVGAAARAQHRRRGEPVASAATRTAGRTTSTRSSGLIRPDTRLIYLNQPHNPTGTLMDRGRRSSTSSGSPARTGWCCSATRSTASSSTTRPTGCRPPATCTSGPSRSAASPRATACRGCGSAGSPPATPPLREAVSTLKDYTTICSSAPSELLTALALRHRRRARSTATSAIVAAQPAAAGRLLRAPRRTRSSGSARPPARSASRACSGVGDVDAFCERLAEAGRAAAPGLGLRPAGPRPDRLRPGQHARGARSARGAAKNALKVY